MTPDLFETLLYDEENTHLDFKSEQYKFIRSTNEEKSELLKDLLVFANAWKSKNAYILLGVEEVKGGRSKVIGLQEHLDEAAVQQFINSKTNRPITFSYEAFSFEGKQVGVIEINSSQERPIFLIKDYNKVKKNVVYIRRGSATEEANPDEVARMGATAVEEKKKEPVLELEFWDNEEQKQLGDTVQITSKVITPEFKEDEIPDNISKKTSIYDINSINCIINPDNKNYFREYYRYLYYKNVLVPIYFVINNPSRELIKDVNIKFEIIKKEGVYISDEEDMLTRPSGTLTTTFNTSTSLNKESDVFVENHNNKWTVNISFDKVQPRDRLQSRYELLVGANSEQCIEIEPTIYADNLSEPIGKHLIISINKSVLKMTMKEFFSKAISDKY